MNNDSQDNTSPMRGFGHARHRRALMGWVIGGLVILLVAGLLVVPFLYVLSGRPYAYYPFPFFFFPFGFLIFLFVAFFAVRALFWGLGWGWRGGYSRGYWRGQGYNWDATEILRQRYAKGEISKDQFDQMMRDLKAQGA
jgi:putative membrane protein